MKSKKITAIVEASSTGFGIYVEDENLPLTSYGQTIDEAKKDLKEVLKEMIAYYKEQGKELPKAYNDGNLEFVYKYDIASIFAHFGMLDATQFAKKIGMNSSLLRQYKTGHALASDKQKQKIEEGLHALGKELLEVHL
jgi:predicted RNase H-like HicB family nuclease